MFDLPERDAAGQLPTYAWPGGYPLIYVTRDGLTLCPACANSDTSDPVTACGVHWEGPPETCEDCGKQVESAYGDPSDAPGELLEVSGADSGDGSGADPDGRS